MFAIPHDQIVLSHVKSKTNPILPGITFSLQGTGFQVCFFGQLESETSNTRYEAFSLCLAGI